MRPHVPTTSGPLFQTLSFLSLLLLLLPPDSAESGRGEPTGSAALLGGSSSPPDTPRSARGTLPGASAGLPPGVSHCMGEGRVWSGEGSVLTPLTSSPPGLACLQSPSRSESAAASGRAPPSFPQISSPLFKITQRDDLLPPDHSC